MVQPPLSFDRMIDKMRIIILVICQILFTDSLFASGEYYKVNVTIDNVVAIGTTEVQLSDLQKAEFDLRKIHIEINLDTKKFSWDAKHRKFSQLAADTLFELDMDKILESYQQEFHIELLEILRLYKLLRLEFEFRRDVNIKMTASANTDGDIKFLQQNRKKNNDIVNNFYKFHKNFLEDYQTKILPLMTASSLNAKVVADTKEAISTFVMISNGRLQRYIQDIEI